VPHAPASTLKILTAETLIPHLDPARAVAPTAGALRVDGSRVGLVASIRYPIRLLFTAMIVVSGNEAADTLADAAGGRTVILVASSLVLHERTSSWTWIGTAMVVGGLLVVVLTAPGQS